jgi:hypothetical protein
MMSWGRRLAGEIADGALPVLVPPQYTAKAREVLGRTRSSWSG